MPTIRPRVFVTESDELSLALDAARLRWPGESRSGLLVRLALEGHRQAQREQNDLSGRRIKAIECWSGAFSEGYDANLLNELREDWPE